MKKQKIWNKQIVLTTLMTARGKEHLEVMFTVFSPLKLQKEERRWFQGMKESFFFIFPDGSKSAPYLIEESLWELLEALGTNKALLVVQLSITVDYLLSCSKAALASLTGRIGQGISNAGRRREG